MLMMNLVLTPCRGVHRSTMTSAGAMGWQTDGRQVKLKHRRKVKINMPRLIGVCPAMQDGMNFMQTTCIPPTEGGRDGCYAQLSGQMKARCVLLSPR